MSRDYLKDYKNQQESNDEVEEAWEKMKEPEVEDILKKHPSIKWFLIITGIGFLVLFLCARLIPSNYDSSKAESKGSRVNEISK